MTGPVASPAAHEEASSSAVEARNRSGPTPGGLAGSGDAERRGEGRKATPEQVAQVVDAITSGTAMVCYTKCWACQFDDHFEEPTPHTWMDEDDAEHAGLTYPLTPELAAQHNCGCYCATSERAR